MAGGKTPVFLNKIAVQLREQNWFALAAELVIVVVGVFLGLQAANWNEERQEREDEEQILTRLQAETATLLEAVREERQVLQRKVDLFAQAQSIIFTSDEPRPLTPAECSAVAGSHIYRRESDQLPILEEMLSTGRFDRLTDEGIKQQLRNYILFRDRQRANHEERTNELFRLYSRHPEAIQIELVPRGTDTEIDWGFMRNKDSRWMPQCNVEQMRSNRQFLNELFDNMGRNGHVLLTYEQREAILLELQQRLDELLRS
ncbi:hypothetical protein [Qipengyuania vesicularis]|uniref:hypothetical protein n=1 Tax=Qipengyuania vesicularis TaxID=2867232 RepID=UPI001C888BF0|nr:hypothetical protein [Qipengyuania vesicularis]MBX7526065.1 hypothetical protein [Qipengyuania vesicularis]